MRDLHRRNAHSERSFPDPEGWRRPGRQIDACRCCRPVGSADVAHGRPAWSGAALFGVTRIIESE